MGKNSKGQSSVKMWMELRFFLSAHCLMVIYICTNFHENILDGKKCKVRIFIGKNSKEHNSVKDVGGVSVLVPCISSDDGLYL